MSWVMIAIGALASCMGKSKPYTPSAESVKLNKELGKKIDLILEPTRINLRKKLPTSYTTEEERQECIRLWKNYYRKARPNAMYLSYAMCVDGYDDVVNKLKIKQMEDWIDC